MDPPEPALPTVSMEALQYCHTPINDDHDDKYGIPTLDELGFDTHILRQPIWIGGETEALARLERHLAYKSWIASFGQAKMTPQSLYASQTGLSPYLRFGCLSTRLFYHELCGKLRRAMGGLMNGHEFNREFIFFAFRSLQENQEGTAAALFVWANIVA